MAGIMLNRRSLSVDAVRISDSGEDSRVQCLFYVLFDIESLGLFFLLLFFLVSGEVGERAARFWW